MAVPLDEFPVHQVPLSMAHVGSSDRNAYDRSYFNAHDRTGDVFFVSGMGVYPNLGVTDAFATLRRGDEQVTVRASDALGDDRMRQQVGPFRTEVLEPLQRIRLICEGGSHGLEYDLVWQGSFPVIDEPSHVIRQSGRVILEAVRLAQVGTWSGTLRVDGDEIALTSDRWVGTRDRSWGIRPLGEPEPPGRSAAESDPLFGFWWTYVPLRFDEFAILVILQEDGDGTRSMNEAVRVWPAESGRPPEQLGWPELDIRYRKGTRMPEGAVLHLTDRQRRPITVDVESLGFVALEFGTRLFRRFAMGPRPVARARLDRARHTRHLRPLCSRYRHIRSSRSRGTRGVRRRRGLGLVRARGARAPRSYGIRRLVIGRALTTGDRQEAGQVVPHGVTSPGTPSPAVQLVWTLAEA